MFCNDCSLTTFIRFKGNRVRQSSCAVNNDCNLKAFIKLFDVEFSKKTRSSEKKRPAWSDWRPCWQSHRQQPSLDIVAYLAQLAAARICPSWNHWLCTQSHAACTVVCRYEIHPCNKHQYIHLTSWFNGRVMQTSKNFTVTLSVGWYTKIMR